MPPALDLVLTLALSLIMFSLGLSLAWKDFRDVLTQPSGFFVGIVGQLLLLPLIATTIILIFQPPQTIALGLLILAIAPGGATSAFMTSLFGGNVALSVSLTTMCGLLVIFTTPVLLTVLLPLVSTDAFELTVPPTEIFQSLVQIVAGPVLLGMLLRGLLPGVASKIERPVKTVALILFFALLVGAIASQLDLVQSYIFAAGGYTIALNVTVLIGALALAKMTRLRAPDRTAIVFECGMQNAPLAMFIAISILEQPELSISPAIYGVLQAPITLGLAYLMYQVGWVGQRRN